MNISLEKIPPHNTRNSPIEILKIFTDLQRFFKDFWGILVVKDILSFGVATIPRDNAQDPFKEPFFKRHLG